MGWTSMLGVVVACSSEPTVEERPPVDLLLSEPPLSPDAAPPRPEEGRVGKRAAKLERAGVEGLGSGGLGTVGMGSGASGYGKGGGTFGEAPDRVASRDRFEGTGVNGRMLTADDPLSTFAIDVDTGSWSVARRHLDEGALPPAAAVRVEEFVNWFTYGWPAPDGDAPAAISMEAAPSPFDPGATLLRVGFAAKELPRDERPVHLTFLVDVSGSMSGPDRLPLALESLRWLVDQLGPEDTVAIATYAGRTGIALHPTPVSRRGAIHAALDGLRSGGGTAMNSGIALAYQLAQNAYADGAENRVVLLSDGDANIGPSSFEENLATVRQWAGKGITLSTVGFGRGNYNDHLMEQLADDGDGNYAYVDSLAEGKRVFGERLAGTIHGVARDVKVQVEFAPEAVTAWRLVGYENRDLADADFRKDAVDAGELGSGQQATALYELYLAADPQGPLATVHLRAKPPGPDAPAREWTTECPLAARQPTLSLVSDGTRKAVAAAGFAELLRGSPYVGEFGYGDVIALSGPSEEGRELARLAHAAQRLTVARD